MFIDRDAELSYANVNIYTRQIVNELFDLISLFRGKVEIADFKNKFILMHLTRLSDEAIAELLERINNKYQLKNKSDLCNILPETTAIIMQEITTRDLMFPN